MTEPVAIVGMACRYPDARSPQELWDAVLSGRRSFRRMPPERLRLEDYYSERGDVPDSVYSTEAALIDGFEFDRTRFRIAGSTYRSADLAHWLALDVADRALADAGLNREPRETRERTAVFVGNTLTGEFSRASLLRLRWPYVRRVLDSQLADLGWSPAQRRELLDKSEAAFKAPFPEIGEDSLAGGLSNTIAGRICNQFDFKGAGYTVDGACASSLLAVATACSALVSADIDLALAGGVDLSLDPFELVGFSKSNALSQDKMRVFDRRSSGFLPGEGCGFVVLMRDEDARRLGRRVYARIMGWGVSSDGSGGLTRPEPEGQMLALRRAYNRAGFGIETVAYFEAHGTGTSVGDTAELTSLSELRRRSGMTLPLAAIGSVKANIGHTKAAAGVAGLIKATMALKSQILPPTTGCDDPHELLSSDSRALRALRIAEPWPMDMPIRAGVSAMGFGGINAHVVLDNGPAPRRQQLEPLEVSMIHSTQDCELFIFEAPAAQDVLRSIEQIQRIAFRLSLAELTDLAVYLQRLQVAAPASGNRLRTAIVASSPRQLAERLEVARSWLGAGIRNRLSGDLGVFFGDRRSPNIGFLFPGQGCPLYPEGGAFSARFPFLKDLFLNQNDQHGIPDALVQRVIAASSAAAVRILTALGVRAQAAVGHSLGEISALHWAGAISESTLFELASVRGKAMARYGAADGAMASIMADERVVGSLLNGDDVVIAAINSPRQTVVAGDANAIGSIISRARAEGLNAVRLPVTRAFHSPGVAGSVPTLRQYLTSVHLQPLNGTIISTITGGILTGEDDLRALLCEQVVRPVLFEEAVRKAAGSLDLFIEVGPGRALSGLVEGFLEVPAFPLDAGGRSLDGLLKAAAAAWVLGAELNINLLVEGRFSRPFTLPWNPQFLVNPCELAPRIDDYRPLEASGLPLAETGSEVGACDCDASRDSSRTVLDVVKDLVAKRTELRASDLRDDDRLLRDLHLSSISVSQLVIQAARQLNLQPPVSPTDYSNVCISDIARTLQERLSLGLSDLEPAETIAGVDSWVEVFGIDYSESPPPRPAATGFAGQAWTVVSSAPHEFTNSIRQALSSLSHCKGRGVCVVLGPDTSDGSPLLEGARLALNAPGIEIFLVVYENCCASSFAKSLHLEAPNITTCVVDVPFSHPDAVKWIACEVEGASTGFTEARYDSCGRRYRPVLRRLPPLQTGEFTDVLGPGQVLLVIGGGKGIAAESAIRLAKNSGIRLAVIGRSRPESDSELHQNLARMKATGIAYRYYSANVTNPDEIREAVSQIQSELGPVSAVLYGAGVNAPALVADLDNKVLQETIAIKVQGARNVVSALDLQELRLFISFGSLIARTGMRGEAHYGLANELLEKFTRDLQQRCPKCRCITIEWSVWSGVGMGERLGTIDSLVRQGIMPIPPDRGVEILQSILSAKIDRSLVVVMGRVGEIATLDVEATDLPFMRFLEVPRVSYKGLELITEAELSIDNDPYLKDHVLEGNALFPAVMGLEAMAQVAMATVGETSLPVFENVSFARPIVVPVTGFVTIRIAALAVVPDRVEVVLRSSETAYQVDHFRALCLFHGAYSLTSGFSDLSSCDGERSNLPVNCSQLYGGLLFHQGVFRRLRGYRSLSSTESVADIEPSGEVRWFGPYLPQTLVLGDPGGRDAVLHSIQACVPDGRLLPVAVSRLVPAKAPSTGKWLTRAQENSRTRDTFTYDTRVEFSDDTPQELWEGLRLQVVGGFRKAPQLPQALLAPYLERKVRELVPGASISVAVRKHNGMRGAFSDALIQTALGFEADVVRTPNGKPEVGRGLSVSVSHCGDLSIAMAGTGLLACDIQLQSSELGSSWRDLLGSDRFSLAKVLEQFTGDETDTAAMRVWTACESLKKAGAGFDAPLVYQSSSEDGWAVLSSGSLLIASGEVTREDGSGKLIIALLAEPDSGQCRRIPSHPGSAMTFAAPSVK